MPSSIRKKLNLSNWIKPPGTPSDAENGTRSRGILGLERNQQTSEAAVAASLAVGNRDLNSRLASSGNGCDLEQPGTTPSPLPSDDYTDPITKTDNYGIKVLYNPRSAVVDIVFIHGLTGSAYTTWLHDEKSTHWPRDLVKDSLLDARVMTFGYDADVVRFSHNVAQDGLSGYARDLLGSLSDRRRGDAETRSILFVAHSLGGLVTQNALSISRESRHSHIQSIEACTVGICFMGTPHHGADLAEWGSSLTRIVNIVKPANRDIVDLLKRQSYSLGEIQESFHNVLEKRKEEQRPIGIVCFYEQVPYFKSFIVPKESAIIPGELHYPIHANHMGMTKFYTKSNKGYADILREIKNLSGASARFIPLVGGYDTVQVYTDLPATTDIFLGRDTELGKMEDLLDPRRPGRRGVALYGIGGSGKTQITLRFIMRHQKAFSAVIWINASTIEHTKQSFAEAAAKIDTDWPMHDIPVANQISGDWQKVIMRLRTTRYPHWLLILDSVDDLDQENYTQYMPKCDHGYVIVTSTNMQASEVFRIPGLEVEGLDPQSGYELLLSRSHTSAEEMRASDRDLAVAIAKKLHGSPLAIEQAAVLLRKRVVSFSNFIPDYENHYQTLMNAYPARGLLAYDKERSIIAVFTMLYNFIQSHRPDAATLLTFISIFGSWAMTISFLEEFQFSESRQLASADRDMVFLKEILKSGIRLRLALDYLADICLVKIKYGNDRSWKTLSLHRAVSYWCVEAMTSEKKAWIVQAAFGLAMQILSPAKSAEPWLREGRTARREYLAPIDRCLSLFQRYIPSDEVTPRDGRFHQDFIIIANKLAQAYLLEGRLGEAKKNFETAIESEMISQGDKWPNSERALDLLCGLASVSHKLGDLGKAAELYGSVIPLAERLWGQLDERSVEIHTRLRSVSYRQEIMLGHHKSALVGGTDVKHPQEVRSREEPPLVLSDTSYEAGPSGQADDDIINDMNAELRGAAYHGDEIIVKLLLGIDSINPNSPDESGRTPLSWAAAQGHEKVVRRLLKHGSVDPDSKDNYGRTPLFFAVSQGSENIVSLLLEAGVDINTKGGFFGNTLQAASFGGHESVVSTLLQRGAEVNAQGGEYGNALQAASRKGHESVVSTLLERGAEVNAQGGEYGNALQAASFGGHESVVSTLLERGAEVNAQGGFYGNALQAASRKGHESVMSMLLERGAEVKHPRRRI